MLKLNVARSRTLGVNMADGSDECVRAFIAEHALSCSQFTNPGMDGSVISVTIQVSEAEELALH